MQKTITEPIDKNYIASLVGENPVIIEIGSYDGKDAQGLADACKSEIYCFEPLRANIEKIRALNDDRLIIFPYAVTCFEGRTVMAVPTSHPQSSSLKEPKQHLKIWPDIVYNESETVNCTTLDRWHEKVNNNCLIDFIWCDVNGSESDLILGAPKALSLTKYLYIEYCKKMLFKKCLSREQVLKALPGFEAIGDYNVGDNYGNVLLKNINPKLWDITPGL